MVTATASATTHSDGKQHRNLSISPKNLPSSSLRTSNGSQRTARSMAQVFHITNGEKAPSPVGSARHSDVWCLRKIVSPALSITSTVLNFFRIIATLAASSTEQRVDALCSDWTPFHLASYSTSFNLSLFLFKPLVRSQVSQLTRPCSLRRDSDSQIMWLDLRNISLSESGMSGHARANHDTLRLATCERT